MSPSAAPFNAVVILLCGVLFLCVCEPPVEAKSSGRTAAGSDTSAGETLVIDGIEYVIPPPWAGHRMASPTLPTNSFRRIPTEYSFGGSSIHVHVSAFAPLLTLLRQARLDGVDLVVESGYRSERYQRSIFTKMMREGRTFADIIRFVAPPGYSQHQFGTAVDFYPSDWRFADTDAYDWLEEHAAAYHFEQTFRQDNPAGFPWEAWHWNYIGTPD